MKTKKIDHIGIVVDSIEKYLPVYTDILGMEFLRNEDMPEYQSKICFLQCGDVLIELLEPYGPCYNMTFLQERGGGISHICYEVDDIESCHREMKEQNIPLMTDISTGAGNSKIFFSQAEPMGNVLTEFVALPD